MGTTAAITIRPAGTKPVATTDNQRASFRLSDLVARFSDARTARRQRSRERRTALANFEEARIHAQIRYRRMRYRHMQI